MKKIILSLVFCLLLILPSFSATSVNTAQLNKQAWTYINQKDVQNAYKTFNLIYQNAKTQQDYEYVIHGYIELIKNDEISASVRLILCRTLQNNIETKITDKNLKNILKAVPFKKINIYANASDEELRTLLKADTSKQDILNDYKNMYYSALNSEIAETKEGKAFVQLYCALYEYAIGNSKTAILQMGNAMNDIRTYCSEDEIKSADKLISTVIDLCK